MNKQSVVILVVILCIVFVVGMVTLGMAGCPRYNVWQKALSGKAELEKQEYAKQILIEQAKAELESAKHLAAAEVERAKGIADSMKIISGQLKDNPEYLQYWAIQAQMKMATEGANHSTVYIPSGANGIPLIKFVE